MQLGRTGRAWLSVGACVCLSALFAALAVDPPNRQLESVVGCAFLAVMAAAQMRYALASQADLVQVRPDGLLRMTLAGWSQHPWDVVRNVEVVGDKVRFEDTRFTKDTAAQLQALLLRSPTVIDCRYMPGGASEIARQLEAALKTHAAGANHD